MQRVGWFFALLVAAVTPAAAQPGIGNDACQVSFIHAPDDVRLVIDRWGAAEPRCTEQSELRVIPTAGGFYLVAQRPDGRSHERLVPDVDAAGVLIASWIADDGRAPVPAPTRSTRASDAKAALARLARP